MKKYGMTPGIIFILTAFSFIPAISQEKTKDEKNKQIQETINEQKKAMYEKQKADKEAQEEIEQVMIIKKEAINKAMEELNDKLWTEDDPDLQRIMREYRQQSDRGSFAGPFPFPPDAGNMYNRFPDRNNERTIWDFSKTIKKSSFSRDYVIDVDPTAKSVLMSVSGDCDEGEIRIKIIMPDGKIFSEIVIDEFGNLNWRKSFAISDTENQDKTGTWKFDIKSSNATGYFKIFFQTS